MHTIIEHLRGKMIRLAEQRGSLAHPEVVAVSQQLDGFIVVLQRQQLTMEHDSVVGVSTHSQPFKTHRRQFVVGFKKGLVPRNLP